MADVERAARCYGDQLGFACELYGDPPDFLVAKRDEAIIPMALCDEPARIVHNRRIVPNVWNVFIRVDEVEAIYAEVQQRGAEIDYTLYDAPSGTEYTTRWSGAPRALRGGVQLVPVDEITFVIEAGWLAAAAPRARPGRDGWM